jgi:putative membrane protein
MICKRCKCCVTGSNGFGLIVESVVRGHYASHLIFHFMHAGRQYTLKELIRWTRHSIYLVIVLSVVPTALYALAGWTWVAIPWPPITLLGTAAAFIIGFRNNATYARSWEARHVWGRIVNASRTFGIMAMDLIRDADDDELRRIRQRIVYRHLAWITALRYQLRQGRAWENARTHPMFIEFRKSYVVPEDGEEELRRFLTERETDLLAGKTNRAAQLLALQSRELRELNSRGLITPLNYVELITVIKELYDQQGSSERIKNFPYPRQYMSISLIFVNLFVLLVPLGMLNEFARMGSWMVWFNVPASVIVSWVFIALEVAGESTENPFEGAPNDVPISAISRSIEIELKELLDEKEIPQPLLPMNHILM